MGNKKTTLLVSILLLASITANIIFISRHAATAKELNLAWSNSAAHATCSLPRRGEGRLFSSC